MYNIMAVVKYRISLGSCLRYGWWKMQFQYMISYSQVSIVIHTNWISSKKVKTSHKGGIDVITWSAGLDKAGATDVPATKPEPERISLIVPLMPSRRSVLAANSDPLAHVERRRIKPWKDAQSIFSTTFTRKTKVNSAEGWQNISAYTVYVDVLNDVWPGELLMDTKLAACATNPWLHSSSSLSGW